MFLLIDPTVSSFMGCTVPNSIAMSSVKQFCLVFLFLLMSLAASTQNPQKYNSVISHTTGIQVNDISYIHWGCVDKDYVRLDEMTGDGILSFCIDVTSGIDVGLASGNDSSILYGIRFLEGGVISIIVDAMGVMQPVIYYSKADQFKIIRCDNGTNTTIRYYKNEELLYSHCIEGDSPTLFQLTTVNMEASNPQTTGLDVVFDNSTSACTNNFVSSTFSDNLMVSSDEEVREEQRTETDNKNENTLINDAKGLPNQIVSVNIHNQGKPIKSYRIRTDANGNIPKGHEVHEYLDRGYQIKIRRDR